LLHAQLVDEFGKVEPNPKALLVRRAIPITEENSLGGQNGLQEKEQSGT